MAAHEAKARVLIVDGEEAARHSLEAAVALSGHRCTSAATVDEAFALCARSAFDCLLLDEQLGTASGLGLARSLDRLPDLRPAKIFMVSGADYEHFAEAISTGVVDGFLAKPVDLASLMLAVSGSVTVEKPQAHR